MEKTSHELHLTTSHHYKGTIHRIAPAYSPPSPRPSLFSRKGGPGSETC